MRSMSVPMSPVSGKVGPQPTVREGPSRKASVIGRPVCWEIR